MRSVSVGEWAASSKVLTHSATGPTVMWIDGWLFAGATYRWIEAKM